MYRLTFFVIILVMFSCQNGRNDSDMEMGSDRDIQNNLEIEDDSSYLLNIVDVDTSASLIERTYYESGMIKSMINYGVDKYDYSYIYYHENGEISSTGNQGDVYGCGAALGTSYDYSERGEVVRATSYEYWQNEGGLSCHELRMLKSILTYHSNGQIESEGGIETCYECDECPCGEWNYYDKEGKLIKTESFGDCYDSVLDCLEDEFE